MKTCFNFAVAAMLAVLAFACLMGCTTIYGAARDERSIGKIADDKKIALDIKYRLIRDKTVKGLDVSVYCFLGKTYLVGALEKDKQRQRAVEIARGVKGVKSVTTYFLDKSKITIGKTVDDSAITVKVKAKLIGDKEMKATQIKVKTILGHVVLLGVVGRKKDIDKAIKHAQGVYNVKKVKSFIILSPP